MDFFNLIIGAYRTLVDNSIKNLNLKKDGGCFFLREIQEKSSASDRRYIKVRSLKISQHTYIIYKNIWDLYGMS